LDWHREVCLTDSNRKAKYLVYNSGVANAFIRSPEPDP
jgi:hypothetical protein